MLARGRVGGIVAVLAGVSLASAAAVLSAAYSSKAAPGAVLDQSYPFHRSSCPPFAGWGLDDSTSRAAQTFTAGITGALTDVVIPLRGPNKQINVAITTVDGAGMPTVGTPLASAALASAPFPDSPFTDTPISFSPPPRVDAGKQYAIVLTAPSETQTNFVAWALDAGVIQTSVSGCPVGTYAGGRAWTINGTAPVGADADFFFQTFVIPARHVTVQKAGNGSGTIRDSTNAINCGPTCSADVTQGQSLTLRATPDTKSTFGSWSAGGCSGTASTCTFTVTEDTTVIASFRARPATLIVLKAGAGTVVSRPAGISCGGRCRSSFPAGRVTLVARPAAGWRFARWLGGCRGAKPNCALTLGPGAASVVSAVFAKR